MRNASDTPFAERLIAVGGETGRMIAERDWSATPLGRIEAWPQSLRTALSLLLMSPVPMVMLWGEDGVMLYNDAYSVFAGRRHPQLLGGKVREGWPEVADFNDNVIKVGLAGGTLAYRDQTLTLYRHEHAEQVRMNLDYSPVLDESGEPAGVLAVVVDTTERAAAEADAAAQARLLELIATDAPIEECLVAVAAALERLRPGMQAAVLLPDAETRLIENAYASTLPTSFEAGLKGTSFETLALGTGSRAAHAEQPSSCADIGGDMPNSGPWRDLCLAHGILAHHCESVVAGDGSLLAALVLGFGETRLPTARELAAAAFGARIAAIAIQRDRSQGVIRRSEGRFRAFVAASTNSIYRMSADWSEMCQLDAQGFLSDTSAPRTDWLDAYIHREDQPRVMRAVRKAIERKGLFELEHRIMRADGSLGWVHSRAVPILGKDGEILEWFGAASDITETRHAAGQLRDSEERQRFLLDVGDRTRTLVDPRAVVATTTRMLGEKLGASRVVFGNVNEASGYMTVRGGWTDGAVAHLPEEVRMADFGAGLLARLEVGETLCASDAAAHPATADGAAFLQSVSVHALVSVPLLKDGHLMASLNVHQDRPRDWTDAEVQLVEAVAERTWDALERAHAEAGRNRAAALSEAQNRVLERAVRDAPLNQTLEAIVAAVEGLSSSGVRASILVLDEDGRHLRRGAAPSLPAAYNQAVDGVAVGPDTGSCGRAVYTRAPVFVSDIATHPLWADFRDLALPHGLRACWSIPILSSAGAVLGTFAMYFAEPREPNPADLELVDFVIPSAALVIERKQSEERLRRSEARYRQIVEGAEEFAIVTLDADGIITSWNTGAERIVGYAAAETIGRPGGMFYVPEDQAARVPERELERARREGRSPNERWHARKNGSLFWGSGLAMALDDGGYLKIFCDRTIEHEADAALRESEARLRESEEHYRHAAELNPQVAWTATPDGQLDRVAARWHEWTGSSGLGDTWGQGLHPADLGPTTEAWIRSVTTGVPYDVEHRVRLRSGDYSWAHTRAYPRRGANGDIVKWYGSTENIHERRMAENALRASEQRYRRLIETIDDGFCVIEMIFEDGRAVDYRHIEMNPSFVRQSGFAAKPGHTVREVVPGFEAHWFEAFGRVALTGRPERIEERSDATDRWYDVRATRVGDPGAHRVALLLTDVSNRRRAEQRLRGLNETLEARVAERTAALRLYRDIVQSDESPVCAFDTDYRIIAFNRAHEHEFFRIFGHHPALWEVLPDAVPQDQASILRGFMDRALAGEAFTVVEQFGDPDRAKPHYEVNYMPLRDESGEIVGAFHHARNISARLRAEAELVQAQEALRQSQKMEAMGQLTGGVAHDFNNLLTPIIGSLDLLQRKGLGGEREQRLISGAAQSAERAKILVQRLLAFARRQPLQSVAVDVARLVTGMADLVSSTTGPQVKVVVDAPGDLPPANADPNQLEMALLNLSVNARDAMPDGGTLRISASAETVEPGHPSGLCSGAYIRLSVADSGIGMDETTLARAVEPFFSTKGIGKGTGLGLSMVHGLASQLGGALVLRSHVGLGTNVEFWLPQSASMPEAEADNADAATAPAATGRALLVDDEELVRLSTADMLNDLGYAVIEASSAEEAMRRIAEGERFDVVVTDHLMPGMNGTDLALAIRAARPGLPVLLISGYAEREGIEPNLPRLTKPFRKDELASSLAQLASNASGGEGVE